MSTQQQSHAGNANDAWERLANGLGWFSIGLGVSELIAAGAMANFIGVRNSSSNRSVLRAYGVREIAAGIGILAQQRPAGWLWARIAGDMLDLASLASAVTSGGSKGGRLARSIGAVAGVTALDLYCASQMDRLPQSRGHDEQSRRASHSALITIDRPAEDLYRQLRDFMRARGEGGESHIFTSGVEIVEDPASQRLRWRARPAAGITVSGNIHFQPAPANRGTIVKAELDSPLSGMAGRIAGRAVRYAGGELLQNELRKFKQLVETGEIATSDSTVTTGIHEAQPPRELAHA
jgi:uncharacterized membrane protein